MSPLPDPVYGYSPRPHPALLAFQSKRCAACKAEIDWSGLDHRRALGSYEDGLPLCASCAFESERDRDAGGFEG